MKKILLTMMAILTLTLLMGSAVLVSENYYSISDTAGVLTQAQKDELNERAEAVTEKDQSAVVAAVVDAAALAPRGGNYVIDETETLTGAQIAALNEKAAALSEKHKYAVYIWIVDLVPEEYAATLNGVEKYTDAFYEKYDLGWGGDKSGILLLLEIGDVPGERDYLLNTYGSCTDIFTVSIREEMLDGYIVPLFRDAFNDGSFYKVADVFLDTVDNNSPHVVDSAALAPRGGNYVIDETETLTGAQIAALNEKAAALSEKRKCALYIWIVDLVPEEYARTMNDLEIYADAFYEKYELGWGDDKNGMVLLLETGDVPGERDCAINTHGSCSSIFNDLTKERMLDNHIVPLFIDAFDNGNFYGVADVFLDEVDDEFNIDITMWLTIKLLVVILVPMLIAWIICSSWKSKLKTAKIARAADNYIPADGFNLTGQEDMFLYRTTTRTRIEQDSDSSSGGGSRSSSSGRTSGRKV